MTDMMAPLMAALVGRPLPAPTPGASLKEMFESLALLDRLRGSRGDSGPSDTVEIVKAVSNVAGPLLTLAAKHSPAPTQTPHRRPLPAPVTATAPTPIVTPPS